ncbi:hypothetical protein [Flavobacterium sp.]|uniref:hypothetical protein n=1 Tax=Flavobacterium sp. TaxID=239 RepID=UPI003528185F
MKKIIIIALIFSFGFTSCGPRRYKCGPYRKCEIKETPTKQNAVQKRTIYTSET